MTDEGVTLELDDRRWKIQYLREQREKLRIKLETRRDPLMMVTIFIKVMCLEEAFEVLDDVIWRDEVAGIILRMRLYMQDAGVIGDECLIANLIDLPANFKEYWCVWGNDVPTDIWLEGDIRRDQKMLPTWVVRSD